MRDTQKIKNIKAQARRTKNMQYPLLSNLSHAEIQHLMDRSHCTKYEVIVSQGMRALKYNK